MRSLCMVTSPLLQEAVEQCGCVLEIGRLTVVFDQSVCEGEASTIHISNQFIQANHSVQKN